MSDEKTNGSPFGRSGPFRMHDVDGPRGYNRIQVQSRRESGKKAYGKYWSNIVVAIILGLAVCFMVS